MRIAERLGQCGELREALEPVGRPPEHAEGVILCSEQRNAILRRRCRRERLVDDPQHLLRRPWIERRARRRDRVADSSLRLLARKRVVGEEDMLSAGGSPSAISMSTSAVWMARRRAAGSRAAANSRTWSWVKL